MGCGLHFFEPQNIEQGIMNVEVRYSILCDNIKRQTCPPGLWRSKAIQHFIIRISLFDLALQMLRQDTYSIFKFRLVYLVALNY